MTGVLFVLLLVQIALARTPLPALAGLHGIINALILIGLGGYLASSNWAFGQRGVVGATVTAEPARG